MIRRKLDLNRAMDVVLYGRMSTDDQNERSPDQQFAEIRFEVDRQRKPWNIIGEFRDDGISGRLVQKRPGLMNLIHQIKTGQLKVGAILVHTLERWGRAAEMEKIRTMLLSRYGVVVLTCDSGFADPTSVAGQALGFVEQLRATSAAPVKAFDVFRGKKDAVLQKHWPGGPPPFGFRLKYTMTEKNGKPEIDFATLEPNPETAWIIVLLFEQAARTGWGTTRLAKWLNAHPDISKVQVFYASTIGYWLDQPIYYGELLWAEHCTDVIDDVRVIQRNDVGDHVRVPDFCEPLVTRELWDNVQQMRQLRRKARKVDAKKGYEPGRVLKLPLTGLVRCRECGSSMQPCTGGAKAKGGQRYGYYVCPRHRSGACQNKTSVREDYLRRAVIATLRQKLFPIDNKDPVPTWLPGLFEQVRTELDKLTDQAPDHRDSLRHQIKQIDIQLAGWMQSLGNPDLPLQLRNDLAKQYDARSKNRAELERDLHQLDHLKEITNDVLNVKDVLDRLKRLDEILAGNNPTLTNVELSRHIDRIDVHADGRVMLHCCRLGVLEGAIQMLSNGPDSTSAGEDLSAQSPSNASTVPVPVRVTRVASRARPRLRVDEDEFAEPCQDLKRASDLGRFRGLDPSWFWTEELTLPKTMSWSDTHAAEVAALWATDPKLWVLPKLAEHFSVSIPTARKALRMGQAAAGMQVARRKIAPKGVEDARLIADQVAELYFHAKPLLSIRQIAAKLHVNQITVSKALNHWHVARGLTRPDGRATRSVRQQQPESSVGSGDSGAVPLDGGESPQTAA
jgi:DNA invertase Pin-like site-specific DNA recombinase